MDLDEAFSPKWPQLSQRKVWLKAVSTDTARNAPTRRSEASYKLVKTSGRTRPQPGGWEYLDHTADIQIHAWGTSIAESVGACIIGMMGYMVELPEIAADLEVSLSVSAHDEYSLLYAILNECLYVFLTETFVAKEAIVSRWDESGKERKAEVVLRGGLFISGKHSQGTEVKAITYSNMQIVRTPQRVDSYVIVDI